jgi:hypothetical protein
VAAGVRVHATDDREAMRLIVDALGRKPEGLRADAN